MVESVDELNLNPTKHLLLGQGGNRVETHQDASAHAELLALRQAARRQGNWRLNIKDHHKQIGSNSTNYTVTLYTTVEPCLLCWAAAHAFRVHRIVYGAPDLRLGAWTCFQMSSNTLSSSNGPPILNHSVATTTATMIHPFHTLDQVQGGLYQDQSAHLLRDFFRQRRLQANAKRK